MHDVNRMIPPPDPSDVTETPLEPETPGVIVWDEPPEPLKQLPLTADTPLEPEAPEVTVWDEPLETLEHDSNEH